MTEPAFSVVGRGALVERLRVQLADRPVVLLHGIPGIGKTTVAWEILAGAREKGLPTAYVEAQAEETFQSLLARLAVELGVALETPGLGLLLGAVDARQAVVAIDGAECVPDARLRDLVRYAMGTLRRGRLLLATRRIPRLPARDRLDLHLEEVPLLSADAVGRLLEAHGAEPGAGEGWPGHPLLLKLQVALGDPSRDPDRARRSLDATVRDLVGETLAGLDRTERRALSLLCSSKYAWPEEALAGLLDSATVDALERRGVLTRRDGRCHAHALFAAAHREGDAPRTLLRRAARALERRATTEPTAGLAAAETWRLAGDDPAAMRALHVTAPLVQFYGLADAFAAVLETLRLGGRWREIAKVDLARTRLLAARSGLDDAVLRAATRSRNREVSHIARSELARVANMLGRFEESREHAASVARELPGTDPVGWSARGRLFFALVELGEIEEASRLCEEIGQLARTPAQSALLAIAASHLDSMHGRPRRILARLRGLLGTAGLPPALVAHLLIHVGLALAQVGRPRVALGCLDRSSALFAAHAPRMGLVLEAERARLLVELGRPAEATAAVDRLGATPHLPPVFRAEWLQARAEVRLARGALREAADDAQECAAGPTSWQVRTLLRWTEAGIFRELGRTADALASVEKDLEAAHARVPFVRAQLRIARARLLADEGRTEEGMLEVAAAREGLEGRSQRPWLARLHREWARLEVLAGRVDDAEVSASLALRHARCAGLPAEHAAGLRVLADVAWEGGREEESEDTLRDAIDLSRRFGDCLGAAEGLAMRAAHALARRDPGEALGHLRMARSLVHGSGSRRLDAWIARLAAVAGMARGDLRAARASARALDRRDPWRLRIEIGIEVASGRRVGARSRRALGVALACLAPAAAARLLSEAEALGVPSTGRAVLVTEEGTREASLEEAAWEAEGAGRRVVLDLVDARCRAGDRARPDVTRSKILTRILRVIFERAPAPTSPRDLFAAVWGPPEKHEGHANLVWVTVSRLRKVLGGGESVVAWVDEGYAVAPDCSFLLVKPAERA